MCFFLCWGLPRHTSVKVLDYLEFLHWHSRMRFADTFLLWVLIEVTFTEETSWEVTSPSLCSGVLCSLGLRRPLVKSLVLGVFPVQRFASTESLSVELFGDRELTHTHWTPKDERVPSVTPPLTVKKLDANEAYPPTLIHYLFALTEKWLKRSQKSLKSSVWQTSKTCFFQTQNPSMLLLETDRPWVVGGVRRAPDSSGNSRFAERFICLHVKARSLQIILWPIYAEGRLVSFSLKCELWA